MAGGNTSGSGSGLSSAVVPEPTSVLLIALGFIFAAWLAVFGVMVLLVAVIGWLFEYYRGAFAR